MRLREFKKHLILRALNWPLVWRWAVKAAQAYQHVEGQCIRCAVFDRLNKYNHVPRTAGARLMVCDRCGLSSTYWKRWPICTGKNPLPPPPPKPQPTHKIWPLYW